MSGATVGPEAKESCLKATTNEKADCFKKFTDRGVSEEKIDKLLRSVGYQKKEEDLIAENDICAAWRETKRLDVFCCGEIIFLTLRRDRDIVLLHKRFGEEEWKEWEPPRYEDSPCN